MKLIVGLGNPGREYEQTRHNVGFWFLSALADKYDISLAQEKRFFSITGKGCIGNENVILLLPQTFMNLSGKAVNACAQFYKIAIENIIVCHDELDIPAGQIRLKAFGGHAGHNGLRDIIVQMGGNDFKRLRIGISRPNTGSIASYVLASPSYDDHILIDNAVEKLVNESPNILNNWDQTQKSFHSS